MNENTSGNQSFGGYLRRLRESRNLSLRQAAAKAGISYAYLSQIEGSKRGNRKSGEEFGPHPQMLKKLADAYEVSAGQLFEQAGYLDNDQKNLYGFSERSEIDRIFDFVIHDPALKRIFSVLDKRAIVNRFEAVTGKRLITWAGESETQPSAKKPDFSGLRCQGEMLYADTANENLTLAEVAQELECELADIETMIKYNQLHAKENDLKKLVIEKKELRKFKNGAIRHWIYSMATKIPVAKAPSTLEEQNQWFEQIGKLESGNEESRHGALGTPAEIGSSVKASTKKSKTKN